MAQTTYTLPDGSTVTRVSLTKDEVQGTLHDLTLQLFGTALPVAGAPDPYSNPIRLDWQTTGAPSWKITEDMTFLNAVPDSLPPLLIRDQTISTAAGIASITQNYQRRWTAMWTLYGPNATDRAALLHALLLSGFARGFALTNGLAIAPDFDYPKRVPELFDDQWWERADFSAVFLERVSYSVTTGVVETVPISVAISQTTTVTATASKGN